VLKEWKRRERMIRPERGVDVIAIESGSISEQTYQELRSRILDGRLAPGVTMSERGMAEAIGVSRTPLRAAISRLEGEGLVERLGSGGVTIRRYSIDDLFQILTVRRPLEAEAAGLATGHIDLDTLTTLTDEAQNFATGRWTQRERFWSHDDALHRLIAEMSGQDLLSDYIIELRNRARMCHVAQMPPHFREQGAEHLDLLECLGGHDPEASNAAMRRHLDAVEARLVSWLTRSGRQESKYADRESKFL
jgi:DNA-binding GntR family transcriptional regulator